MISTKNEKLIIIILVVLNLLIYSGDCYLYFFNKPEPKVVEEEIPKKPKEDLYITSDFFKDIEPQILGIGYYQQTIGSLIFYKSSYNDNLIRIIIGEQDELTNLTYESILSTIKFIDKDNYEEFSKSFNELKDLESEKFQITLNPTLDEIEKRYLRSYSDYKFVLIEINREL